MSKPKITSERINALLIKEGVDLAKESFCLVGVRGYFRNSMGQKGKNDIGIWDDGFIWVGHDGELATFNGNVDPSRYYKNVATLKAGKWRYKKGYHGYGKANGHMAFRQAAPVVVLRYQSDGSFKEYPLGDTINIHRGGNSTTSSAGCQTLPPAQWDSFREYGYMLLNRYAKKDFLYLLVNNDGGVA